MIGCEVLGCHSNFGAKVDIKTKTVNEASFTILEAYPFLNIALSPLWYKYLIIWIRLFYNIWCRTWLSLKCAFSPFPSLFSSERLIIHQNCARFVISLYLPYYLARPRKPFHFLKSFSHKQTRRDFWIQIYQLLLFLLCTIWGKAQFKVLVLIT